MKKIAAFSIALSLVISALSSKPSSACGMNSAPTTIQEWKKSASGQGYDLIIQDDEIRYYVPEDDGFLMLFFLYALENTQYDSVARENNFHPNFGGCPKSGAGEIKIGSKQKADLFREAATKIQAAIARLDESDDQGTLKRFQAVAAPLLAAGEGNLSLPLPQWCELGRWLGSPLTVSRKINGRVSTRQVTCSYSQLADDEALKDLDPKALQTNVLRIGTSSWQASGLAETYGKLATTLSLPPSDKPVYRGGCNPSIGGKIIE